MQPISSPLQTRDPIQHVLTSICKALLMAYVLVMPWITAMAPIPLKPFDFARVCEILLMLACALGCAWLAFKRPFIAPSSRLLFVGLLIAMSWGVISVFRSAEPAWALKEAGLWLGVGTIAAMVSTFSPRAVRQLLASMLISHLFYNVLNLIFAVVGMALSGAAPLPDVLTMGYENRRFFNHVQTIALPLVMVFCSMHPRKGVRVASQWMVGTGLALLLATGGRASLLGIGLATFLAIYLLRANTQAIRHIVISCAWGALTYVLVFLALPALLEIGTGNNLTARAMDTQTADLRWQLALVAWEYIKAFPWLGIGPMHLAHAPNNIAAHPHNIYLQIAAEWGLPMLLLFAAFVCGLIKSLIESIQTGKGQKPNLLAIALLSALVALLTDGWFSGNFVMPVSLLWIGIVTGLVMHLPANRPAMQPGKQAASRALAAGCAALAFAGLLGATCLTLIDARHMDQVLDHATQLGGKGKLKPRYWSSGWF